MDIYDKYEELKSKAFLEIDENTIGTYLALFFVLVLSLIACMIGIACRFHFLYFIPVIIITISCDYFIAKRHKKNNKKILDKFRSKLKEHSS